ncbi:hypothetical protein GE09DRAFT_51240 [Coniochaeta sp. 2T2.1]|nr:hypothetical protein GE09DRAFT_51240 [Coniochaeta sp. 2T2.1]
MSLSSDVLCRKPKIACLFVRIVISEAWSFSKTDLPIMKGTGDKYHDPQFDKPGLPNHTRYFSLRYGERDASKKSLGHHESDRLDKEIQRIDNIRARLESEPKGDSERQVLEELRAARKAWRQETIERLAKRQSPGGTWRQKKPANKGKGGKKQSEEDPKNREENLQRERERVARTLSVLRRLQNGEDAVASEKQDTEASASTSSSTGHDGLDFRSYAMYFERADLGWEGKTYQGSDWLTGEFPNQKVSARRLLESSPKNITEEKKNPLAQRNDEYLRYFHFPTNNMAWIEDAIARYYDEDTMPHDNMKSSNTMSRAQRVLCREYWRGQMHGSSGKGPIHARHMRPRCSTIPRPPDPNLPEPVANTRCRKEKTKNVALFLPYLHWEMDAKRAHMAEVVKMATCRRGDLEASQCSEGLKPWRSKLGTYLMHAARASVIIDLEPDTRLTRKFLHHKPPLHIRRTLDQYYFLTLADTSKRDRDQVVYRATNWGLKQPSRNARIVMVDQLWLWILDDHTIISAFPRRWGRNKPDSSGVHKCLRERMHAMKSIDSVHHLALIIIEQCSKVFFDRTKPLDQRPEVIDMFLSAIGNITEQTSIAHDTFWKNTTMLASGIFPANTRSKYLNINPEGTLLKEARDIAEELGIMQRVFKNQQQVVRDYRRYLARQKGESHHEGDMITALKNLAVLVGPEKSSQTKKVSTDEEETQQAEQSLWEEAVREADVLLELIENHQAEIRELEESASRNCQQLESLLSFKQQQAGIVEARESIKQGRTIMAFTLVTIFFLPLGFFAAVFGMNNAQSTNSMWMTLRQQVSYMCKSSSPSLPPPVDHRS